MDLGNQMFPTLVVGRLPRPQWVRDLIEAYLKLSAKSRAAHLLREKYG